MDRLKNKNILIGKAPGKNQLQICLSVQGKAVMAIVSAATGVPNCVSRCKPEEGVAHCRLAIDAQGAMKLTNMKDKNVTYVNGTEIMTKKINFDSQIELGSQRYRLPLQQVLDTAKKLVSTVANGGSGGGGNKPVPGKEVHINHLEKIWLDYEKKTEDITLKQQEKGKRRMLPMLIGSLSGLIAPLLAALSGTGTLYVTLPISAVSFLVYFKVYNEKDTSLEERKQATDELIDNYVCPECRHFVGNMPYKVLRQNKKCPYCKVGWKE